MNIRRFMLICLLYWAGVLVFITSPGMGSLLYAQAQSLSTVSGIVRNEQGAVNGALVRLQATVYSTRTRSDGTFDLSVPGEGPFIITAWAEGYYVGSTKAMPGATELTIDLKPYYTTDNTDYTWFSHEGADGSLSCSHCMPCYTEWQADAHSQSAINARFLTMYNGTDVDGNQSPPTRYGYNRDYGSIPLRPDLSKPYYGPGYKLDFPNTAGNCATCHVPGAAAKPDAAYAADVNQVSGIDKEGVFCEFCHKIGDVTLDSTTGLPYPNMPGVLSMRLYRPTGDQQMFFGNFDDVTRRVTYLPLVEQSAFCASCHYGIFWDTTIYNSFGEWLESPYSDAKTGKTCQNCHMPPVTYNYFVFPEKGGLLRDPNRIYSHRMPGAADTTLLQNTADLSVEAKRTGSQIAVSVKVTNTKAGHHIPTDSPLRQIFVIVKATDAQGRALTLQTGPTLPDWAGDLKELPGVYFAKILQEIWTEVKPSGAYWVPTRIVEDTRLPALVTSTSTYVFDAPDKAPITIQAKLVFRRAFYELLQQKGWNSPDIVMEEVAATVN